MFCSSFPLIAVVLLNYNRCSRHHSVCLLPAGRRGGSKRASRLFELLLNREQPKKTFSGAARQLSKIAIKGVQLAWQAVIVSYYLSKRRWQQRLVDAPHYLFHEHLF
jgi:hypothetical protein